MIECPVCKKTDTIEDAGAEAAKAQIQAMLSGTLKGSRNVTVNTPGPAPRWTFGEP